MKIYVILFFFVTVNAFIDNLYHHQPNFNNTLMSKCNNNSLNGVDDFQELSKGLHALPDCVTNSFSSEPPHPLNEHDKFCSYLRDLNLYACVENFTQVLAPCLDPSETYFPDYLLNVLNSTYQELCGVKGLSNIEYLQRILVSHDLEVHACLQSTGNYFTEDETYASLTVFKNLQEGIIDLNINDLCTDVKSLKNVFSQSFKYECRGDYTRFVDIYFHPLLDGCNTVEN